MLLPIGARVGSCEIVGAIGKGGMGEVYRARDSRLGRDVAIKILPEAFAADVERVTRFQREARTLAALNHPNIAAIYGLEENGSALMMEFVDGDDLARRIARGPIPIGDALAIARQITDALEAAHEQGIVHRDLKPANVIVKSDGTVKLIDFGLAKAFGADSSGTADADNSPTITAPPTERGVILGTPAYMSPEQARGRSVDKRTDIWAFGVVLFEMLSGARAFAGEGFSDVLAAVIAREINWQALPPETPAALRSLLERCLDPDPKQRLRDIGEARVAITALERGGSDVRSVPSQSSRTTGRDRFAWTVAAVAIVVAAALAVSSRLGWIGGTPAATPVGTSRLSVMPPAGMVLNPDSSNLAISPDGRMVAFVVGPGVSAENQLWVRALDSQVARRIESGDGVSLPFWSPDSARIGFFAGRKLKTVAASGGPAQVVCDAPFGRGAAWGATNVIVVALDANGPLYRVSADGGTPVPVTTLDAERQETSHRFPLFLPDGDRFLYPALPAADGLFDIFAGSLANPKLKTRVGSMESAPAFAEPGSLLFTRQGVLVAQAFDAKALTLSGAMTVLGDEPRVAPGTAAYDAGRRVSASMNGSLAFIPDPAVNTALEWRDLSGKLVSTIPVPPARYIAGSIAPDQTRAALVKPESGAPPSVWIVDLVRSTAVPVGTTIRGVLAPVWSPDSRRLAFVHLKDGRRQLSVKTAADASPPQRVAQLAGNSALVRSWTTGEFLLNQIDPETKWNIYRLPETGAGEPTPVIPGPAIEVGGWLSPTRRWIAYLSDEGGRLDLFVQAYPNGGAKEQISTTGVLFAGWDRDDSRLLFFTRDLTLWRVDLKLSADGASQIGTPTQLGTFPATLIATDFVAQRQQFLTLVPERSSVDAVTIVQHWRSQR